MEFQASQPAKESSGSGRDRSTRDKRQNPQQQISQIEKSVTQLLVATKQLLETLTQWSRGTATEGQVSDIYVRLGYEFNIACRAFSAIGVETSDLGPVPDLLRSILEETLSQEASQASLDRFLPRIRDIIINLLHGLKKKQLRLRQRKDGQLSNTPAPRKGSTGSFGAEGPEDSISRQIAGKMSLQTPTSTENSFQDDGSSARAFSMKSGGASPTRYDGQIRRRRSSKHSRNEHSVSASDSSVSNTPQRDVPSIVMDSDIGAFSTSARTASPYDAEMAAPPSQMPPKQRDALAALQSGAELERRASRRFSAYQISKHLGAPSSGMPVIPPTQHSPIPHRGINAQESISAVRARGSLLQGRQRSRNRMPIEISPISSNNFNQAIQEIESVGTFLEDKDSPSLSQFNQSPTVQSTIEKLGQSLKEAQNNDHVSATSFRLTGPVDTNIPVQTADDLTPTEPQFNQRRIDTSLPSEPESPAFTPQPGLKADEQSPSSKELVLFLQYKSKVKKIVLADGYDELSVGRLQLAFIEKFSWNTHNNGVDLPDIYIQDPISGVRHELEDLNDVKNRSVLVLNIDALDEVKRHLDDGIGGLRRVVEGVRTAVDDQQTALQRVSDRQQETVKEMARLAAAPVTATTPSRSSDPATSSLTSLRSTRSTATKQDDVQNLRRDLAVMRQTWTSFSSDMEASMSTIRAKASEVKTVAIEATIPSFEGDSGRAYVNSGKKQLSEDSEKIVNRVDDLQDIVEDLRKDVVTRGVRPLPRQLEAVSRDVSTATSELKKIQEYLKREKPLWTKIWEKELQVVCDDRDLLTMQEELAADLEDDLDKAAQTFALVEQATKQQNMQNVQGNNSRSASRNLNQIDPTFDPVKAKDGVLGEVRALQPNHDTRLEAIQRSEKARQRELASRKEGEFAKELGSYVEGGKLKKSGGVEEAERQRKAKDERIRKEVWNRMNGPAPSDGDGSVGASKGAEANNNESNGQLGAPTQSEDGATTSPETEFVEASEVVTVDGDDKV